MFAQVKNIANLFSLDPSWVYLVEETESLVVFPLDSGKFKTSQIIAESTYEVHGTRIISSDAQCHHSGAHPFGAYTQPTYHGDISPPHPPPRALGKIKKSIVVVSLSKKGKHKKGKLEYTAVTQVVVSISPSDCNVSSITPLVSEQVGFQAILLDSKCYPLLSNESTSGVDFWRSTRKILAASRAVYEKVTGIDPSKDVIGQALDLPDSESSPKRRRVEVTDPDVPSSVDTKLIIDKLTNLEKKLEFLDELNQGLICAICKYIALKPVVSPCCQRIIGCEICVNRWLHENAPSCPFCNTTAKINDRFLLKGFDDVITIARVIHDQGDKVELQSSASAADFESPVPF